MRTKAQKAAAKKRLKLPAGKLQPVDLSQTAAPDWMTRAYQNNRYVVMINDNAPTADNTPAIRAMVQRHDDKPIPNHWAEMQAIKNGLFGPEATAVEYYPPQSELVDKANIYWLWVFQDGVLPKTVAD